MFWFIICALSILTLVSIYLLLTWNNNYWQSRGIPCEKPKFFSGNLGETLSGKVHFQIIHCNIYNKFNNVPYCGFYKLRFPGIIVRDLDIIRNVVVKDFASFSSNDFHIDPNVDPVLAGNPFVVNGEEWKTKRTQWSSGMTQNKVKLMFDVMQEKADFTVKYLEEHVKNNPKEPLEAKLLAFKYLTDSIVASVLGLKINSFEDPENEFITIASKLFETDFWSGLLQMCYFLAPWVHSFLGIGFVSKQVINKVVGITKQVIEIRKQHGFLKNDFFEVLLKNENVSEMEVAGRVLGFLNEGIETSSGLISFTLYELAANLQVQSKLRQEIMDSVKESDGKLTYEALHSLPYLNQVINESLRLHPPVFSMTRLCTKEYELPPVTPGGKPTVIPVGMPVVVPTYATAMDPEYFKDPETFDPERFSEENKDNIRKFSFMPFGDGPRICVGQRLGLTNSKNCIAHIIKNFELRVSPKTQVPLQINPTMLVNRAIGDLWLTIHKISE